MVNNNKRFQAFENSVVEISFNSTVKYKSPFNEIELDVAITDPDGRELLVPAFWAGVNTWKVRYSSPITGKHNFRSICTNTEDNGLNNRTGIIEVSKYNGKNLLLINGRLRVSNNSKYLEHINDKPFFWLGDTWWSGFTKRCKWPDIFKKITEDRVKKGFSVVQIVAGLHPDFGKEFNELEANESGYAWDKDFNEINPRYFDTADIKIKWLINSGIMPCIFGSWGYYLPWLGIEKMKKHWRYIIARWAAYPVIWCVAGEARMPYYVYRLNNSPNIEEIKEFQAKGWAEVARFIRQKDPFNNLITVHPSPGDDSWSSRDVFDDPSLYDIDMLQTGHSGVNSFGQTYDVLQKSLNSTPTKPVINGEVCYEGIMGSSLEDTQRFLFWSHILSGAAGYTYGADGIWTFRFEENYIGDTGRWSTYSWKEAMELKGSYQLGLAKKFLENFEWFKFEPHPEWVEPHHDKDNKYFPYCAGIPGKVRVIYIPGKYLLKDILAYRELKVVSIEKNSKYIAYFFDPRKGNILDKQKVVPDKNGQWVAPRYGFSPCPSMEDWVLVLENKE